MSAPPRRGGFTLIELIVVVVVLGILASTAVPKFMGVRDRAAVSAVAAQMVDFADAIERYHAETGAWPADGDTGVLHADLFGHIDRRAYETPTAIGGDWDNETNAYGITQGVGVHFKFVPVATEEITAIDELIDDGNVTTGAVRLIDGDRYLIVIAE